MKAELQKPQQKQFTKKFLAMDMAERLIRVEQTVSSSFNKEVPYNKTSYYLSMSPEEKKDFENYLKNKSKKKMMVFIGIFGCLFLLPFFNFGITGNVISDTNSKYASIPEMIVFSILGLLILTAIFLIVSDKSRKKTFEKHSEGLENSIAGKMIKR